MTPPHPLTTDYETRTKPTVVGADERGELIWARLPTPAQDEAWIAEQHRERDAFVHCARTESMLSVRYRKWAEEETNPDRAAHYATEATRLRRNSKESLRAARVRNI